MFLGSHVVEKEVPSHSHQFRASSFKNAVSFALGLKRSFGKSVSCSARHSLRQRLRAPRAWHNLVPCSACGEMAVNQTANHLPNKSLKAALIFPR
jgi:hypothetical protein